MNPAACIICTRDPAPGWNPAAGAPALCRLAPEDEDPGQVTCRDLWHAMAHDGRLQVVPRR